MMRKVCSLVIAVIFMQITALSQNIISEELAEIVARKFFHERKPALNRLTDPFPKVAGRYLKSIDQQTVCYIFNMQPQGFVAVSASRATTPVLCYSFNGQYSVSDEHQAFKSWMGQYEQQIMSAIAGNVEPDKQTADTWDYYLNTDFKDIRPFSGREVIPMLTSQWDQGTYYNGMCPEDPAGPDGHCVTGCVATALGQLLNYFRWPLSGTGSYSYDCPPYGTLSADFSAAEYQWDLMSNSLSSECEEVAEIIYHLGVSVDMVYGPDGSGMYNHKAAYTLKTFFKYSPETQYVYRDSTTMDWDSLLVTHLEARIPMYYAGWSVPNIYGHAFICDGYQGEGYYHFNWGWGGSLDGYFYTDNLTPGGNNFNLAQELVINAVPDTSLYTYPVLCSGDQQLSALTGTIDDGSGPLYPYGNGAACNWLISPNDSVNGITLDFHRFMLHPGDTLYVHEGDDLLSPLLGAFTGQDNPGPVTSGTNAMLLRFISGADSVSEGFLASFSSEIPVYCNGMVMLNNQTDTLNDGSGTWDYHNNSICSWRVMPQGASSVTLYFNSFETEPGLDIVKIYDLQTQELLAEYSGTYESGVPDPVTSPSGMMFVTFTTNPSTTAQGWEAIYESNLVGIGESDPEKLYRVYPNPAHQTVSVRCQGTCRPVTSLRIFDLFGRLIRSEEYPDRHFGETSLSLQGIPAGTYLLQVKDTDAAHEYFKLMVR